MRGIKNVHNNCISALVRKCHRLDKLALGECIHLTDAAILEIATYKQNIKYLDLNQCKKITDNSLTSLASFCTQLDTLILRGTSVTDIGLLTLSHAKFINNIKDLNLSYLPVSEPVLKKILKNAVK
jgi:energy-converting hydrogenase Eha subunit G